MSVEEEFKNFVNGDAEEQTNSEKTEANGASHNSAEEAQNINEGTENVKTEQNGNEQTSNETKNKPREWLQSGKTLVVDGRLTIPNEEQRQKYNNWCNENSDKPWFNYAITAYSLDLEDQDRREFISLGMQGKLDGIKLREFAFRYSDGLPDIESWEDVKADENLHEPEENIKGLLHKGSKMVIGGPSKSRKTWLLIDLALSIAAGKKWLVH
jgi:glucan-binding YG repeat protein